MIFKRAMASALISSFTFTSIMCSYSGTTPIAEPKLATQEITEFVKGMRKPGTSEDEQPTLTTGDSGALNLALLSDPKVLQYVKDYFAICDDAHKGNIFDFKVLLDPSGYFGINLAEQGVYPGTALPISYIPKSKVLSGYGGNGTLYNYNGAVCGSVGVQPNCDAGSYYTAFQLDSANAGLSGKKEGIVPALKGKYKGGANKNVTSSHQCDRYYFPDQLHQVNKRINNFLEYHKDPDAKVFKKQFSSVLADWSHARGEASVDAFCGVPLTSSGGGQFRKYCLTDEAHQKEFLKLVNDYFTFMYDTKLEFKYIKDFTFDVPMARFLGIFKLVNSGWKLWHTTGSQLFTQLNRYDSKYVCGIYSAITGQQKSKAEIIAWVKSSIISTPPSGYNFSDYGVNGSLSNLFPSNYSSMKGWGAFIDVNCKTTSSLYKVGTRRVFRYVDGLNFGHQLVTGVVGKFSYGRMLAWMKLPVDPSNPSTYLIGGNGGGKSTGSAGVTPVPEIKKGDYVPSGNIVKPTCTVRNVVPARSGVQLLQKGLCAYFTKDGKPNANTIVGNPSNFSPINSVGEKDGMPVFTQGQYYTNGVKDYNGYRMPAQGCPIFAFCSLMYGVGMGTDKSPHLTNELKKVLASSDCPSIGGIRYLTPMALAKGLDWLHGGSPWTAYNNMFKKKLNIDVVSKTWSPSRKAKDLEEFEKELSQGYGFVLSVTSKKMKWYRPKDLAKKEVEFACDSVVTGGNHFVTVYTIDTYKDTKTGKTFKGVQVIDGANLCGHSRGRFLAGECDNDFILDLSSLHDAKNFGSPFHRFTFPISATSPTSSSNSGSDTSDGGSQTGGHYVVLDDTVRALNSRHSIIDKVAVTGGNKGYVTWGGEKLSNFYIYPQDITLSNGGSTLIYKAEDSLYYKLTCFKGKFGNITAGTYNSMNKVLSAQDDILIEKFMDSSCTTPVDFVENILNN